MKKYLIKKEGSTLILLVLITTVISVLGVSLMTVTMMNYKFKKTNTEMKQCFYMSEHGLNKAYTDAYRLICNGIDDSLEKADDFLKVYPSNIDEAENIFKDNYKMFISSKIKNSLKNNGSPKVLVVNTDTLTFIDDKLMVSIKSEYISENNIVKITMVDLTVNVPDYEDAINNSVEVTDLLSLKNWDVAN